ncbi:MAG: hypothetical protein JSV25_15750 [Spirochaetota bacterium]|nr:MAG: hypothetical protein JSV25_15750 [Spirochaetota bacterium]
MAIKIKIKTGGKELTAVLNESATAKHFYEQLPLKISMQRWGDEYYGDCGLNVDTEAGARAEMEVGELAIWPNGSALCIFFGPTPVSTSDKPKAISPVNPIGNIEGDVGFLKALGGSISIEVEKG